MFFCRQCFDSVNYLQFVMVWILVVFILAAKFIKSPPLTVLQLIFKKKKKQKKTVEFNVVTTNRKGKRSMFKKVNNCEEMG